MTSDIDFQITLDYSIALFDGHLIFDSASSDAKFNLSAMVVPVFLKEYCWIVAVRGDPGALQELSFSGNQRKHQLAALTLTEYKRSIANLRQEFIFSNVADKDIDATVNSLCNRFGILEQLKQYARRRLMEIYNDSRT